MMISANLSSIHAPCRPLQSPACRNRVLPTPAASMGVTMRDRGKNRKPLQRGRISTESIQTIQALKRASGRDDASLQQVFDSRFRRLLKLDMIAVLRELLRQNECYLALKVFEDVRREYWYKPKIPLYADMIEVFASNGLFEQVKLLYSYLQTEQSLEPEIEGFNKLLRTLMSFELKELATECYCFMKELECEPDRSTFRILINGLESMGEAASSASIRQDAQGYYGESLDFLQEEEEMQPPSICHSWNRVIETIVPVTSTRLT